MDRNFFVPVYNVNLNILHIYKSNRNGTNL